MNHLMAAISSVPPLTKGKHLFLIKKKGSAYLVDKIKDDYLGSDKTINSIQSNGLFTQIYEVPDLFSLRDLINKDPEADDDIKLRLNSLCDQLDINDNPVFLTAKMK